MTVTIKYQAQVCCGSVVPGKGNYGGVCLGPENKTKKTDNQIIFQIKLLLCY